MINDKSRKIDHVLSKSKAMTAIETAYYYVIDDEIDVEFTFEDGAVRARVLEWWQRVPGEGDCSDGNRACALHRALEDLDGDAEFHCGCRGHRDHPDYSRVQDMNAILNLTECILQSQFDPDSES